MKPQNKKVLIAITKSNFGGAQRYVYDLAVGAKHAGHDVSVLCGGEGLLVDKLKESGIRVISLPTLGRDISILHDLEAFLFILRTLKSEKPDVFHTNSSKMGGMGNLAARLAGIKTIIFTSHGWAFNEDRSLIQKIILYKLVWFTIFLSHLTICVSEKTENDVEWMPFIKQKLVLIHNGIEAFPLMERLKARNFLVQNTASDELLVGTMAELHRIKGLDILLEAWSKFKQTSNGTLIIMGTGEEKDNLQNMAQKLHISDSVVFKGYVDNAKSYLSGLDIFVLPSRSENLPYAILEAGLSKLPIIATRVGGIPEIITNGVSGKLIQRGDVDSIVENLILLSKDKDLRTKLGQAIYEKVTNDFSINKMLDATLKLYE